MLSKVSRKLVGRSTLHAAHHYVHLTYLGLVFIESHGLYGIAAGVLGVIILVDGVIERVYTRKE